jgi:hypothetical protein
MAEEEKEKAEAGMSVLHDISASTFLLLDMDIQNLQCIYLLSIQLLKPNLTLLSPGKPSIVRYAERRSRLFSRRLYLWNGRRCCSNEFGGFVKYSKFTCQDSTPKAMGMLFHLTFRNHVDPCRRHPSFLTLRT